VCVTPPPAPTLHANRVAMYETLASCFAYLSALREVPTPAPIESPLPSIASRPTFYVFATGAVDPAAAAVLIRSVVEKLAAVQSKALAAEPLTIAPRADWTDPASFAAQCEFDPNTRGALVVETSIPETERRNYFLITANITNVWASVEMLGCSDDDHMPQSSPLSLFAANGLTGKAHETALTTGILESLAGYFITDRSSTNITIVDRSVNYSNSQRSAPALNGSTVGYLQDQNLNFPAQNASAGLAVASRRFAQMTMDRLHDFCRAPELLRIAAQAKPAALPAPPEHRTVPYEAAALYADDCARFANFTTGP
jgi:hypothetical protein